ncbi:MAG: hypothetical protein Q8N51_05075 [Gammaproteobacteria bacterium]|nr:hypothetical protein [Gammaproteobacteria bacterium]
MTLDFFRRPTIQLLVSAGQYSRAVVLLQPSVLLRLVWLGPP